METHQWASLVTQWVKNLPAMQETQVRSLSREDPLEKGMAIHSRILAWIIPWTEEPVGYTPQGWKESDTTEQLTPVGTYWEAGGEVEDGWSSWRLC